MPQITPLLKKPKLNADELSNYRPISNLNNISKLLERLFLARLQPHLINSPHYNPLQSAYRTGHSTETALLTLLNKARLSSDRGESTLLVSLDLSAAFDTIDHSILLARLRSMYDVDGSALMWLESYLVSEGSICGIWSGCLLHYPAQNRCSSGFGSWTHPFHFLHLPHSICHQPVQC